MIKEDFEREHLKESVYLQADKARTEEEIMQEIIEEENRLPAKVELITPFPKHKKTDDKLEINPLPF